MMRFAMNHPSRVHGIVAINTEGAASIQEKLVGLRGVLSQVLHFTNAGAKPEQTGGGSKQQVRIWLVLAGGEPLCRGLEDVIQVFQYFSITTDTTISTVAGKLLKRQKSLY